MNPMESISNAYLASINGLAEKIGNDLSSIREAYQDVWYTLSREEQDQVLNEAVIDPAAVLKYSSASKDAVLIDAPSKFSWFTKSQLNLFTVESLRAVEKQKTPIPKKQENFVPIEIQQELAKECAKVKLNQTDSTLLSKIKNKVPIGLLKTASSEEKQSLVECKSQNNSNLKTTVLKPKTPPPPPPPLSPCTKLNAQTEKKALLSNDVESDHSEDIPKTGFDFLDNW